MAIDRIRQGLLRSAGLDAAQIQTVLESERENADRVIDELEQAGPFRRGPAAG